MQKKCCLIAVSVFAFIMTVNAQKINTDSLSHVSKISEYQLQMGKLKNLVDQKTRDKQDAEAQAQRSADQNSTDAKNLSNDPENKKLARKAENAASDAKRDSKRARVAADNLDGLNKNIDKLANKIAKEQSELNRYIGIAAVTPVPPPPPAPSDTTHQQ